MRSVGDLDTAFNKLIFFSTMSFLFFFFFFDISTDYTDCLPQSPHNQWFDDAGRKKIIEFCKISEYNRAAKVLGAVRGCDYGHICSIKLFYDRD